MRIAAVLPAYNAAPFIGAALDSVRAQTRPVDEIVVADDASRDDTAGAVATWSRAAGVAVRVVRLEVNGGAGAARNAGFMATDADVVAMLDADDTWEPNMVASLAAGLEANPDAVLAFGLREYVDDDGPRGEYQGFERLSRFVGTVPPGGQARLTTEQAYLLNLDSGVSSVSAAIVRRQAALDCGLFDPAFRTSQDREFVLRLSRTGPFVFVNAAVSNYRLHAANTTHARNAVRNSLNGLRVVDKMFRQQAALGLTERETEATRAALARAARAALSVASTRGLDVFLRARRDVGRTAAMGRLVTPRMVLRACWRTIVPDGGLRA